jgi:hypothetical protein
MPAVGGTKVAGGVQVLGDQRRVLICRVRVTLLDRDCKTPVPLGAIGFQL